MGTALGSEAFGRTMLLKFQLPASSGLFCTLGYLSALSSRISLQVFGNPDLCFFFFAFRCHLLVFQCFQQRRCCFGNCPYKPLRRPCGHFSLYFLCHLVFLRGCDYVTIAGGADLWLVGSLSACRVRDQHQHDCRPAMLYL